jgi:hypothetical protein
MRLSKFEAASYQQTLAVYEKTTRARNEAAFESLLTRTVKHHHGSQTIVTHAAGV